MPILKDTRNVKTVRLVVVEDGEVEVYDGLLAGDVEKISARQKSGGGVGVLFPLSLVIKNWNFTNEAGEALPITEQNIALLDVRDVMLIQKATGLDESFLEPAKLAGTSS